MEFFHYQWAGIAVSDNSYNADMYNADMIVFNDNFQVATTQDSSGYAYSVLRLDDPSAEALNSFLLPDPPLAGLGWQTGTFFFNGSAGGFQLSGSIALTAIPEPTTLLLTLLGLGSAIGVGRRAVRRARG